MNGQEEASSLDRIERAIARIEAAAKAGREREAHLAHRHETLRTRIGEVIAALDAVVMAGDR